MTEQDLTRPPGVFLNPLVSGKVLLRGIGQVMFQGNAGTGLLFLIGIAVASPSMAVGALIGAAVGPIVAYLLKFDRREIEDGIHGFNPTLVGIGLVFYLKPVVLTWVLVVLGCVAAAVVTWLMRRYLKFPTYTAPFIVTTWAFLLLAHGISGRAIDADKPVTPHTPQGFVEAVLDGPAEVMFGANMATGLLFLAGLAVSSWRHATLALGGSVIGALVGYYHSDPESTVSIGIYGYNAVLTVIAIYLWRKSILLPILGAILSVPLTEFFPTSLGLPPLTAPFVAATWVVLAVGRMEPYFCTD